MLYDYWVFLGKPTDDVGVLLFVAISITQSPVEDDALRLDAKLLYLALRDYGVIHKELNEAIYEK